MKKILVLALALVMMLGCFATANAEIGAIANMVHPLSAEAEIAFYLNDSGSVAALTPDQFYGKFANIRKNTKITNLIITSVADALSPVMKVGYALTQGRKITPIPKNAPVIHWKEFFLSIFPPEREVFNS